MPREIQPRFVEAERTNSSKNAACAPSPWLDEGLVAVAQIDAAPDGGPGEHAVRPGAIGQLGNGGGAVAAGIEGHGWFLRSAAPAGKGIKPKTLSAGAGEGWEGPVSVGALRPLPRC